MSSRLADLLKRFVGYFGVSLLGTAVDTAVLWVCSHLLFSGSYFGRNILSPTISFECAVFVNFCNSYFFVWKDRISKRSTRSFFRHYAAYNASCTGTFLLKMGLLQLVVLKQIATMQWELFMHSKTVAKRYASIYSNCLLIPMSMVPNQ